MTGGSLSHLVRSNVPDFEQHGTLAGEGLLEVGLPVIAIGDVAMHLWTGLSFAVKALAP